MLRNLIFAWLLVSIVSTSIHCKKVKDGRAKNSQYFNVKRTVRHLQKRYNIINNLNSSHTFDEEKVRRVASGFLADVDKLVRLVHRDDLFDDPYTEQLRSRIRDKTLDLHSIKVDVFRILFRLRDVPEKGEVTSHLKELKEIHKNLSQILDKNSRRNLTLAKEYIGHSVVLTTDLFSYLFRKCPENTKNKLEKVFEVIDDSNIADEIKSALRAIKEIIDIAEKNYKEVHWRYILLDFEEYKNDFDISRTGAENNITDVLQGIKLNLTSLEFAFTYGFTKLSLNDIIGKFKKYLLQAASELRKFSQASNIHPEVIYADRVEKFAYHIKSKKDLHPAVELIASALKYDWEKQHKSSLDDIVVDIKKSRKDISKWIEQTKYKNRDLQIAFKMMIPGLKDNVWRLAARKHVKGFSQINTDIQDVLDNIRDDKGSEDHYLHDMIKISKSLDAFFNNNKNV